MSSAAAQPDRARNLVRLWLLTVAALVFAMVLVGGATRLTESGLSIVEWKPLTGALPPLTADQWQAEFVKYQSIPQNQQLNRGMSLDEFKTIYWWEWAHRLLGRLVGAAFLLPLLFFLWRGWIAREWRAPLWGIFVLGAIQGAVGWWMVASGLADRVSVSQYRLAFHLTLACVIYAALIWFARRLLGRGVGAPPHARRSALALLILALVQIYLGALVAGLDAGLTFNTWPLIDGAFIPAPERLFFEVPLWRNLFENALTVQFNHRMMAYVLWVASLLHAIGVAREPGAAAARGTALALAIAVTGQAVLGIVTLLYQAALPLALAHQGAAMIVLTVAVVHAEAVSARTGWRAATGAMTSAPRA